jgi:hypothetical protein
MFNLITYFSCFFLVLLKKSVSTLRNRHIFSDSCLLQDCLYRERERGDVGEYR